MALLSVAIITLNEERNIGRCLMSLGSLADEIVVVDSFSTDKTEEICSGFNVRFVKHVFEDYADQKNYAATLCTNNLVLSLDADEAISPELAESIKKVKESPSADGYTFNRATFFCGKQIKHCGWYPDRILRLWNIQKGEWTGKKVHEKFSLCKGSVIQHINGDLLHYSYYSIEENIAQINRYSTLSAQKKFEKGTKSNLFKITFNPAWRFFLDYFIKLGILDGYYGYVICVNAAHEVFLKYSKLRDLWAAQIGNRSDAQ